MPSMLSSSTSTSVLKQNSLIERVKWVAKERQTSSGFSLLVIEARNVSLSSSTASSLQPKSWNAEQRASIWCSPPRPWNRSHRSSILNLILCFFFFFAAQIEEQRTSQERSRNRLQWQICGLLEKEGWQGVRASCQKQSHDINFYLLNLFTLRFLSPFIIFNILIALNSFDSRFSRAGKFRSRW